MISIYIHKKYFMHTIQNNFTYIVQKNIYYLFNMDDKSRNTWIEVTKPLLGSLVCFSYIPPRQRIIFLEFSCSWSSGTWKVCLRSPAVALLSPSGPPLHVAAPADKYVALTWQHVYSRPIATLHSRCWSW